MKELKVWDWFVAAVLHDLGKLDLDPSSHRWGRPHRDPTVGSFAKALPAEVIQRVAQHHDSVNLDERSHDPEAIALIMADRFQKAMHQVKRLEEDPRFDHLRSRPSFYPYYGPPNEGWTASQTASLIETTRQQLAKGLTLRNLLEAQKHLLGFPHTSYLPHLSLSLHNQFTAILFYFLCKQMEDSLPPTTLRFSLLTVTPEAVELFYRLRSVEAHRQAVRLLNEELFRRVFKEDGRYLPGLAPAYNPFAFFSGNSLVLVYDEPQRVVEALQEIVSEDEVIRSLLVEITDFELTGMWEATDTEGQQYFDADPKDVRDHSYTVTLMSERTLDYPRVSLQRCNACGKPSEELKLDEKGDNLCPACLQWGRRPRKKEEVVNLQEIGSSPDGRREKIAYIFLTVKEPLRDHSVEVAEKLLSQFMDQRLVEPRLPRPSKTGLLEYLQAVREIESFQNKVEEQIEELRKRGERSIFTLMRFPTLMIYLLREDQFWRFVGFLNNERQKLRLDTALRTVVCDPKTPFWSLMDRFTAYDEGDYYYDAVGGGMVMFTKQEVQMIRDVAAVAEKDWRSAAQLKALSKFALNHNLEELVLEMDIRAREDKLSRRLHEPLEKSLRGLEEHEDDEAKNQTKRAKFIDYVAKLARPQKGRR